MMRNLTSIVLTVVLSMTLITSAFANQYPNDSSWLGDETKDAFYDVTDDQWYAEYANEAYHRGLFEGTYPNEWVRVFLPNDMLTREQAVALLNRIDGSENVKFNETDTSVITFSDVKSNAWYADNVRWAQVNGITTGITDSLFGIGNSITREELATLISRYVNFKGISLKDAEDAVETYADADNVSDWAKDSVECMRKSGILLGDENGSVRPKDPITRAEAATIFVRLDSLLVSNVSELFCFNDNDVASINFVTQNHGKKSEIKITEKDIIVNFLENFRSINVTSSKSISGINGGDKFIEICGKDGECLFSAMFSNNELCVNDHRIYYLDSEYIYEYYYMLTEDNAN